MEKLFGFILIFLISLSTISSLCEEGQIDINTASKEELDEIYLIGEVKAQAIIDSRPFDSIDELLNVYGIGEKTLEKIKGQGLACVLEETKDIEETKEKLEKIEEKEIIKEIKEPKKEDTYQIKLINLTTKTIKSQNNKENKSNKAMYWFVAFCILLGILFMIKKKEYKNEFR